MPERLVKAPATTRADTPLSLPSTNAGATARIRCGESSVSGSGLNGGTRVVTHYLGTTPDSVIVTTHHALVIIAVTGWSSTQFSVQGVMTTFGSFSTNFTWLVIKNPY